MHFLVYPYCIVLYCIICTIQLVIGTICGVSLYYLFYWRKHDSIWINMWLYTIKLNLIILECIFWMDLFISSPFRCMPWVWYDTLNHIYMLVWYVVACHDLVGCHVHTKAVSWWFILLYFWHKKYNSQLSCMLRKLPFDILLMKQLMACWLSL